MALDNRLSESIRKFPEETIVSPGFNPERTITFSSTLAPVLIFRASRDQNRGQGGREGDRSLWIEARRNNRLIGKLPARIGEPYDQCHERDEAAVSRGERPT